MRTTTPKFKRSRFASVIASVGIFAALSLCVAIKPVQADAVNSDISFAISFGSSAITKGASRGAADPVRASVYLGSVPTLYDILGPDNTCHGGQAINFDADYQYYQRNVRSSIWGVYEDSAATKPIKDAVFAVSHDVIEESPFGGTGSNNLYWNGTDSSDLKTKIEQTCDVHLSEAEKELVAYTYKADAEYVATSSGVSVNYMASRATDEDSGTPIDILSGARFFPLSAREAETYWSDNSLRKADGVKNAWWLRSATPNIYSGTLAGLVAFKGSVHSNNENNTFGVRPACNINTAPIVLTSYAGPNWVLNSSASSNLIHTVTSSGLTDLRVTLHNDMLDGLIVADNSAKAVKPGETVEVSYAGVKTGVANGFVTALIKDCQGNVEYAGHVATTDNASGKATITIPANIPSGNYSLILYVEQDNNAHASSEYKGKLTNYAGALDEVRNSIPLSVSVDISYKASQGGSTTNTLEEVSANGAPQGSTAVAYAGYTFVHWTDPAGNVVSTDATFVPPKFICGWVGTTYIASFEPMRGPGEGIGWNFNESGGWYYVNTDGSVYNDGWHWIEDGKFGNHWYYFKDNGFIATNQWIFTDAWYYVNGSGSMNVGTWNWIGNAWYGFNWNGTMCKGWIYDSNYHNWFYCDPTSGAMYTNCWSYISGAWYGFWVNGEMCRGWVWDSYYNGWFYCSTSDGHMYTSGWYRIDNKSYYFNASGLLV